MISFSQTYKRIKSLSRCRPCCHGFTLSIWPCLPCETAFTTKYWACAALLLDYYADFYVKDTALMQSLWFHLFDVWQESAAWLPTKAILEELDYQKAMGSSPRGYLPPRKLDPELGPASEKSKAFKKDIRETVELIEVVLWGRKASDKKVVLGGGSPHTTQETVLYDPHGEASCPLGEYETGPWVSGVKPWAQFLGNGGPGVAPPFLPPTSLSPSPSASPPSVAVTDFEPEDPVVEDVKGEAQPPPTTTTVTRYIPHPAIGLLDTHAARARALATKHYTLLSLPQDELTSALDTFARHNPVFPTPRARSHTYTSPLLTATPSSCPHPHPRTITYTLGNGTPPILRYATGRWADGDSRVKEPDWNLLDECVAWCKGESAYEAVGVSDDEEDEDGGESEGGRGEDVFDMWTVVETIGEGEGKKKASLVLGKMFDTWCGVGEFVEGD